MANPKIRSLVLIVMLVSALPARALAADDKATIQQKKVAAAAKLDALKADDLELEAAVRTIDAGIAVQSSETDAARQAANAATVAVDAAAARLAATERKAADLRSRATAVAVQAYIHPSACWSSRTARSSPSTSRSTSTTWDIRAWRRLASVRSRARISSRKWVSIHSRVNCAAYSSS